MLSRISMISVLIMLRIKMSPPKTKNAPKSQIYPKSPKPSKTSNSRKIARMVRISRIFEPNRSRRRKLFFEKNWTSERRNETSSEKKSKNFAKNFAKMLSAMVIMLSISQFASLAVPFILEPCCSRAGCLMALALGFNCTESWSRLQSYRLSEHVLRLFVFGVGMCPYLLFSLF